MKSTNQPTSVSRPINPDHKAMCVCIAGSQSIDQSINVETTGQVSQSISQDNEWLNQSSTQSVGHVWSVNQSGNYLVSQSINTCGVCSNQSINESKQSSQSINQSTTKAVSAQRESVKPTINQSSNQSSYYSSPPSTNVYSLSTTTTTDYYSYPNYSASNPKGLFPQSERLLQIITSLEFASCDVLSPVAAALQ